MSQENKNSPTAGRTLSDRALWLLILGGLLLNLFFWKLQPTVWLDEISYSDPAVNWVRGTGFVSSAWYAQGDQVFWAGNVPLHQFILAGWLKVFGISEWSVRSLGYVLGCLAVGLIVWAGKRLALYSSRFWMVLAIGLLLWADGTSFSYRSGRSDALTLLLAGAQLLAFTMPRSRSRSVLIFSTAALAPWAGLQLMVYFALVWVVSVIVSKGKLFRDALAAGTGSVVGAALLLLFYISQGVLGDFFRSIRRHTAVGEEAGRNWIEWLQLPVLDRSAFFLLLAGLGLVCWALVRKKKSTLKWAVAAILVLLLLPWVMKAAGTYKLYYAWMALVPATLLLLKALRVCGSWKAHGWAAIFFLAAMSVGLPTRFFFLSLADPLALRSEASALISQHLQRGDRAISHSKFYYSVRTRTEQAYFPSYLQRITPEELDGVNLLILDPRDGPWPPGFRKEEWKEVARLSPRRSEKLPDFLERAVERYILREINLPYDVIIYRRNAASGKR